MKGLGLKLTFILLSLLSFFPRAVEVINKNYVFGLDQGRDYLAVANIVNNHKFTLIGPELGNGYSGISFIFHGPFYYYFLSLPFILTSGDPYGGVVLMFLFGLGSVVLSYILGKKLLGKIGGLVFSFLIAISPPLISQSRFTWNPHPGTFFILLCLLFISSIKKNRKYIFWAGLTAAFTYNFDLGIAVVMCFSLLIYAIIVLRIKNRQSYALLFLGFLVGFSPMLFFEARHGFEGLRNMIFYLHKPTSINTKNYLMDHLQTISYVFVDSFPKQLIIKSTASLLLIAGLFLYFLRGEKDKELKNFFTFILIIPIVAFAVFMPLKNGIYEHYLTELIIAVILALIYIFCKSINKNKIIFIVSLFFLFTVAFIGIQNAIVTTKSDLKDFGGNNKIKGIKQAVDYIYNDAGGKKFGVLEFSPAIFTDRYDYVFNWYGKKNYSYIPYKQKKGLVYLLIEVDSAKPWTYKAWLENEISSGRILSTQRLPSGFIVQKRMFD